ncbi:MAG: DUF5333 domain-containing protein [Paracoccaceae bacterium]
MKRAVILMAMLAAAPVAAQSVALNKNTHITNSLVAGRAGDVIRNTCPTISARMFTVWRKMEDLKSYALAQGYKEPEVRAFLKDKTEKARIRKLADEYLAKAGAKPGDVESYCRVGRNEIARGTLMGSLLRSSI